MASVKYTFNPFSGNFDAVIDQWDGSVPIPVANVIAADLTIASGYTLIHANTEIADGIVLEIADGGELTIV